MAERIITLSTNRSDYDIKQAAESSITVAELIEELRYLPGDCKVVFKNDGGYTYGYIQVSDIDSEYPEPEEEEDEVVERADMEYDITTAVNKSENGRVKLTAVWDENLERQFLSVGFNDSRVLGVAAVSEEDDSQFIPIEELSDDEVENVWVSMKFW